MDYLKYVLYITTLVAIGILYEKFNMKNQLDNDIHEYEMVRKYLLNDSSLARSKMPILWIHVDKEINARWWESFYSRNTKCLNQPYQLLAIKSIINKCGSDFNICLIDDSTFSKLIPGWTTDFNTLADPIKSNIRNLALARLLYNYGGFLVPSSFICLRNMYSLYERNINDKGMSVGEMMNRTVSAQDYNYISNSQFLLCDKGNKQMKLYIDFLNALVSTDYTSESVFIGSKQNWLEGEVDNNNINIITAEEIGGIDDSGGMITADRLVENEFISLPPQVYGIYIPEKEILNRTKLQWVARLSSEQILKSNTNIGKYLLLSNNSML
tara:strand:- start:6042 stop:7019 length:978 start_codon:yes stop_codon:yes gene_type:complete